MPNKPSFPELIRDGYQLQLPLPDIPHIQTRIRADVCHRCACVHVSAADDIRCRVMHKAP